EERRRYNPCPYQSISIFANDAIAYLPVEEYFPDRGAFMGMVRRFFDENWAFAVSTIKKHIDMYKEYPGFSGGAIVSDEVNRLLSNERPARDDFGAAVEALLNHVKRQPHANYDFAYTLKEYLLKMVFEDFLTSGGLDEKAGFRQYVEDNSFWIEDYALFHALYNEHNGQGWWEWEDEYKNRDKVALERFSESHAKEITFYKYMQFLYYERWQKTRGYARARGKKIAGDMPIYPSKNSAEAWARQDMFDLTKDAGAPPEKETDPEGQNWHAPTYKWQDMEEAVTDFWRQRIRYAAQFYDAIRIDHLLGLCSEWLIDIGKHPKDGAFFPSDPAEAAELGKRVIIALSKTAEKCGILLIGEDIGDRPPAIREMLYQLSDELPNLFLYNLAGFVPGRHANRKHAMYLEASHDSPSTFLDRYQEKAFNDDHRRQTREFMAARGQEWRDDDSAENVERKVIAAIESTDFYCVTVQTRLKLRGPLYRINEPGKTYKHNWLFRLPRPLERIIAEEPTAMATSTAQFAPPSETGIKAIFFDVGDVINPFDAERTSRRLLKYCDPEQFTTPADVTAVIRGTSAKAEDSDLLDKYETGQISTDKFYTEMKKALGLRGLPEDQLKTRFFKYYNEIFMLNPDVVEVVTALKAAGYLIYITSNTSETHLRYFSGRWSEVFNAEIIDGFITSHMIGRKKSRSDPLFFNRALEKWDLMASEVVFIDDSPDYCACARGLGMHTITYTKFRPEGDADMDMYAEFKGALATAAAAEESLSGLFDEDAVSSTAQFAPPEETGIKEVFFDLGNVVYSYDDRKVAEDIRKYCEDPDALTTDQVMDILFSGQDFDDFNRGLINEKIYYNRVKKALKLEDAIKQKAFYEIFTDGLQINAEVVRSIEALKKAGYKVNVISNICSATFKRFKTDYKRSVCKHIDQYFTSFELGMMKSADSDTIFQKALQGTGIDGNEAIFIDDVEEFCDVARSTPVGMYAIQYDRNTDNLSEELRKELTVSGLQKQAYETEIDGNKVIMLVAMEGWSKKGGQGDYVRELGQALSEDGHMVFVVTPDYQQPQGDISDKKGEHLFTSSIQVGDGEVDVNVSYTHESGMHFLRFRDIDNLLYPVVYPESKIMGQAYSDSLYGYMESILLSKAGMYFSLGLGIHVDNLHFNDWQAALGPVYMSHLRETLGQHDNSFNTEFSETGTNFVTHNLGYQGVFKGWLGLPEDDPLIHLLASQNIVSGDHNISRAGGTAYVNAFPLTNLPWELRNLTEKGMEFWSKDPSGNVLAEGQHNFLKGALEFADVLTPVSEGYAPEMETAVLGAGLGGIVARRRAEGAVMPVYNGVRIEDWDPATLPSLGKDIITHKHIDRSTNEMVFDFSCTIADLDVEGFTHFSSSDADIRQKRAQNKETLQALVNELIRQDTEQAAEHGRDRFSYGGLEVNKDSFMTTIVARLVRQKGFSILFEPVTRGDETKPLIEWMLNERGPDGARPQIVILATPGDNIGRKDAEGLRDYAQRYKGQMAFLELYSADIAQLIMASGDFFFMPSQYEPGGISNVQAARLGMLCGVTETGGLKDFVDWGGTHSGFKAPAFDYDYPESMRKTASGFLDVTKKASGMYYADDDAEWRQAQASAMTFDADWSSEKRIPKYRKAYTVAQERGTNRMRSSMPWQATATSTATAIGFPDNESVEIDADYFTDIDKHESALLLTGEDEERSVRAAESISREHALVRVLKRSLEDQEEFENRMYEALQAQTGRVDFADIKGIKVNPLYRKLPSISLGMVRG
ncbi:MAG: 4-alpha-glucanotransferase, partial [Candidatus Omnitrophota bacterium]